LAVLSFVKTSIAGVAGAAVRQLYHLRHARDYEELGLPMGASKLDIKKAYR
jgi:DnaJ-class molecular chaperone